MKLLCWWSRLLRTVHCFSQSSLALKETDQGRHPCVPDIHLQEPAQDKDEGRNNEVTSSPNEESPGGKVPQYHGGLTDEEVVVIEVGRALCIYFFLSYFHF